MVGLNAHERPPEPLRQLYKKLRSIKPPEIESNPLVFDLRQLDAKGLPPGLCLEGELSRETLDASFDGFLGSSSWRQQSGPEKNVPIYTHEAVPGRQSLRPTYWTLILI